MAPLFTLLPMLLALATPQEGLHVAAEHGDVERVRSLVKLGQDADVASAKRSGRTPLHTASEAGFVGVVAVLLEAQARTSAGTSEGWTPLHLAAAGGQVPVIEPLLAAGAPIEAVDGWGDRPLHLAAENGWSDVVRVLLEAGAEPDARDHWGRSALHRAVAFGHVECTQALLAGGVPVDARSASGASALHVAASRGDKALYDALVTTGAKPARKDGFGRTAAELLERARRGPPPARELDDAQQASLDPNAMGAPILHLWRTAGAPGPGGFRPHGLELAIWSDGVVLYAAEAAAPGRSMRVGRLSPTALAILEREVDESGLPKLGDAGVSGPESSSVEVQDLRSDPPTRAGVDPYYLHILAERGGSTEKRRVLRAWLQAKQALRSSRPPSSCALEELSADGHFRGWRAGIPHQEWIPRGQR